MKRKFELIVLDWDGTIADSESRIVDCFRRAGAAVDLPACRPRDIRETIGLALNEAAKRLYPGIGEQRVEDFLIAYRGEFLSAQRPPTALFPGAAGAVRGLRRNGYTIAIATGKSRRGLDRELSESGLADVFADSRCADETRSKPHPEMLLQLTHALNVSPAAALMVGDTTYDMEMAQAARSHAIGVGCGVHPAEALRDSGALDVIPSLVELPAWLEDDERGVDHSSQIDDGDRR